MSGLDAMKINRFRRARLCPKKRLRHFRRNPCENVHPTSSRGKSLFMTIGRAVSMPRENGNRLRIYHPLIRTPADVAPNLTPHVNPTKVPYYSERDRNMNRQKPKKIFSLYFLNEEFCVI